MVHCSVFSTLESDPQRMGSSLRAKFLVPLSSLEILETTDLKLRRQFVYLLSQMCSTNMAPAGDIALLARNKKDSAAGVESSHSN